MSATTYKLSGRAPQKERPAFNWGNPVTYFVALLFIAVSLAPVLGHAFSPFLRFKGGKALGPTGGTWVGLVGLWAFPMYATFALPATLIQTEDGWSACAGMLALLGYAILSGKAWMVTLAALNAAIIFWTHRHELAHRPQLRGCLVRLLQGRGA